MLDFWPYIYLFGINSLGWGIQAHQPKNIVPRRKTRSARSAPYYPGLLPRGVHLFHRLVLMSLAEKIWQWPMTATARLFCFASICKTIPKHPDLARIRLIVINSNYLLANYANLKQKTKYG